jgi:formylglycine-generating enzyme required for sulfatase activity/predicted Ser/Thr protein kinase
MAIVVQCPNPACRASCSVADTQSGKPVRCGKCGKSFALKPTVDGRLQETRASRPSAQGDPLAALPAQLGRYRVLQLLGKGGMGAVYLAEDSQLGRQVALKMPFVGAAESPERIERFVREARSAASLHHPNVCTVFDAGQIDGRPFITMAYIAGTPLADEIDADVPMDQRRAAQIARKVALALEHAHKKGIVHRDLKPANVMMAADGGEPVVMDFGLARRLTQEEDRLTRDGGVLGTPSYMSPEQVKGDGQALGPATDVYSLGVMLFEMLTGKTPYSGPMGVVMAQILAAPVPPVREFRPDVDPRLEAICRKALAKKPASRFPSMAEFAAALEQYLTASSDRSSPGPVVERSPFQDIAEPTAIPRASKKRRAKPKAAARRPYLAVAVGLVALALAGLLAVVFIKVKTPEGVLIVQVNEPGAEIYVDGTRVNVAWDSSGKKAEVRVKPGTRKVEVKKDGVTVRGEEVTVEEGGRQVFAAKVEKPPDKPGKVDPIPPEKRNLEKLPGERTEEFDYMFEGEKQKGTRQVLVLDIGGGEKMEFVRIVKGVFLMGSLDREGEGNEMPERRIEISRDFYLGKYEVTQAQYRAVTGKSPSKLQGDRLPVEQVPWPDAVKFCQAVSEWTKRKVSLPTEAEHEYACRAGTRTPFHFGSKLNGDLANCDGTQPVGTDVKGVFKNKTVPVGSYPPNPWGLYDMEGNVWEWCQDFYGPYDKIKAKKDPVQLTDPGGYPKSFRGGSWVNPAWLCRAAARSWGSHNVGHPAVGFRVCLRLEW